MPILYKIMQNIAWNTKLMSTKFGFDSTNALLRKLIQN